ncbi:ribonuclease J [Candidatus Woesearchaeota archaeon CG07_land_8_20_14_0_80_44_23]|nr:MAG: ribonuclease J [Candidatus Woesearchaeota archaeon CG07_land_8_20_14_0_80_44_23]
MIEICAVGGYNEVGRNMTAIKVGDEVVILDMGLHVEKYVTYSGDEEAEKLGLSDLTRIGAVPDDSVIKEWKGKVKAIIPTHAHLDHLGAVPFMANSYNAPIIGTPYTIEVLKGILRDQKKSIKNPIKTLNPNSRMRLTKNIEIEFINATHSTPQTVMVVLHTKEGKILYANDYKFDAFPVIGKTTNTRRLRELGKEKVAALIMDCTRAREPGKTPSETVAKEMMRDVLLGTENRDNLIILSTFSSHIARLSSVLEMGKKINRKVIFMGRSLAKYIEAAEKIHIVKFSKEAEILKYGNEIKKRLRKIDASPQRGKYLLVTTGNQGEPNSVLSRIATGELPLKLRRDDQVIFSCNVIPTPVNIANRDILEYKLAQKNVRIFKGIHVSGHASKEDQRDLISMVKPQHIVPAHGDIQMTSALSELASEMGYSLGKNVHLIQNGQKIWI